MQGLLLYPTKSESSAAVNDLNSSKLHDSMACSEQLRGTYSVPQLSLDREVINQQVEAEMTMVHDATTAD